MCPSSVWCNISPIVTSANAVAMDSLIKQSINQSKDESRCSAVRYTSEAMWQTHGCPYLWSSSCTTYLIFATRLGTQIHPAIVVILQISYIHILHFAESHLDLVYKIDTFRSSLTCLGSSANVATSRLTTTSCPSPIFTQHYGLDVHTGDIVDTYEAYVWEPALVK